MQSCAQEELHKFFMQSCAAALSPGLLALDLACGRLLSWWASSAPSALPWFTARAARNPGDDATARWAMVPPTGRWWPSTRSGPMERRRRGGGPPTQLALTGEV